MGAESFPWAVVLFVLGLALLVKGGDWFVDGAVDLAEKIKIPELIIGATVVSIGTTLPEVMVSASAAVEGLGAMSYGNAVGSIICNTALISAITVAVRPSKVERKPLIMPVCFFFAMAVFYMVISYTTGYFARPIGIILLVVFCVYIALNVKNAIEDRKKGIKAEDYPVDDVQMPTWKIALLLVVGAAFIAVGARLLVDNGTIIAKHLGVPDSVIALTFVALGTSLPELTTAIVSLMKGHGSLSLGNIIGANLFNLVLVNGFSVTLAPYDLPVEKTLFGKNASLVLDLPLMFLVMAILIFPALIKGKLSRWQGIVLLTIYAGFCVIQFAV